MISTVQKTIILLLILLVSSCDKNNYHAPAYQVTILNDIRKAGAYCGHTYYPPTTNLIGSTFLTFTAKNKLDSFNELNYFAHTPPNNIPFHTTIFNLGYSGTYVGENLSGGFDTFELQLEAFLRSEPHCKNIMGPSFTKVGWVKGPNTSTLPFNFFGVMHLGN